MIQLPVFNEQKRLEVIHRPAMFGKQLPGRFTLQSCKPKYFFAVALQYKVDCTIAEVADTIE